MKLRVYERHFLTGSSLWDICNDGMQLMGVCNEESDAREIVARYNAHEGLVEALDRIHHIRSEPPTDEASEMKLRECIHIAAKALAACGKAARKCKYCGEPVVRIDVVPNGGKHDNAIRSI